MCGFVGYYCLGDCGEEKQSLNTAVDALVHRGPDDRGVFFDDQHGVGLGHRRLSVIDLSAAGHQPMATPDQNLCIVYNGEVYNFRQIRKQLIERGHRFTSLSDTEVVISAYRHWGPRCLEKLIGMFAFAIWDRPRRRLFLARDRLGIKPLYVSFNGKRVLFGSELKALMAFPSFERRVDAEALQLYLHYQYVPAPRTIFANTHKLEPGCALTVDGNGIKTIRWWAVDRANKGRDDNGETSEKQTLDRLEYLLTQSVADRMISDVPIGALLSGGVDSSLVAALMQQLSPVPVKTFTIGFTEQGFNEAPSAKRIADFLGTDHSELYLSFQDALQVIARLPAMYDEPFADSSAIPTYLISRLTRQQVTVALSGDGGDEQFAGYLRYRASAAMASWLSWCPLLVRKGIEPWLRSVPVDALYRRYRGLRPYLPKRWQVENFPDKWQKLIGSLRGTNLAELYRLSVCIWSDTDLVRLTGSSVPVSRFEEIFDATRGLDPIDRLTRVDQATYLPDAMLTKVDRASMAASLEVRVPLLDHRVVEYVATLPVALKVRKRTGKYLLKRLLARHLPRELVERPKMGFGVPIAQWLKKELRPLVGDYLSPARLQREGRFDHRVVSELLTDHRHGRVHHQHRIWALLMWEMWRDRWGV